MSTFIARSYLHTIDLALVVNGPDYRFACSVRQSLYRYFASITTRPGGAAERIIDATPNREVCCAWHPVRYSYGPELHVGYGV